MNIPFTDDDLINVAERLIGTVYDLLYLTPESPDKRYKPIMHVIDEIDKYFDSVYGDKHDKQLNLFGDC